MGESPDVCDGSKTRSVLCLNALNFFLANAENGVGPFLVVFLTSRMQSNPGAIGLVMGISTLVGAVAQIPFGSYIDKSVHKRRAVVVASSSSGIAALLMGYLPSLPIFALGQSVIAASSAIYGPAVSAITLGLVGRDELDRQAGRNQTASSAGGLTAAIALGACGYYSARYGIFWFVAILNVAVVASVSSIRRDDIDRRLARGADGEKDDEESISSIPEFLKDRRFLIILGGVVLYQFAAAGMGTLVSQILAKETGSRAMLYQAAMTGVTMLVIATIGWWLGKRAAKMRRKPLYIVAFAVLPVRASLYLFVHNPVALVSIQALDGLANGVFSMMGLLVLADITKGTGRFNLSQGILAACVGIGSGLSNVMAGQIAKAFGFNVGFITSVGLAVCALLYFIFVVPETKRDSPESKSPSQAPAPA